MKKMAIILAVLMAIGAVHGYCISGTVDGFLDNRAKSDLAPVADSAKMIREVSKGVDKTMDAIPVIKERNKILDPVRTTGKETVGMTKKVINYTWDLVTFKSLREKK